MAGAQTGGTRLGAPCNNHPSCHPAHTLLWSDPAALTLVKNSAVGCSTTGCATSTTWGQGERAPGTQA